MARWNSQRLEGADFNEYKCAPDVPGMSSVTPTCLYIGDTDRSLTHR